MEITCTDKVGEKRLYRLLVIWIVVISIVGDMDCGYIDCW